MIEERTAAPFRASPPTAGRRGRKTEASETSLARVFGMSPGLCLIPAGSPEQEKEGASADKRDGQGYASRVKPRECVALWIAAVPPRDEVKPDRHANPDQDEDRGGVRSRMIVEASELVADPPDSSFHVRSLGGGSPDVTATLAWASEASMSVKSVAAAVRVRVGGRGCGRGSA